MRQVTAACGEILMIGRQGENLAAGVIFDVSSWLGTFGDSGVLSGVYQRAGDTVPYPVAISVDGGQATWAVTALDTERKGYGKIELTYIVDEAIVKSAIWGTYVSDALGQSIEPPDPVPSWLDEVLKAAARAEMAAVQSAGSAVQSESWAVGGTGSRVGEDTDNSKYYALRAAEAAQGATDAAASMGVYAVCHDEAASPTSEPNTWYVPKDKPRPSGTVGMMVDVYWEAGNADGLGYDVSLVWGEPGGADNEVIIDTASVSNPLTGEYSIPTEGAVRYQLVDQNGRMRWQYVSGNLISRQYSTDALADAADKPVHGLQMAYLPGMEIYVQLDNGNAAPVMRLVPDEGETLPVYGNGTGATTGTLPAGYILHLANAGDHWQIINTPGSGGGAVDSVNGKTGAVMLTASDVGALPDDTFVPSELSQLTGDSAHRTVTDAEKANWDSKSDFSGSYTDLRDKPTIPGPAPVASVNGQTGEVVLTASDVGAATTEQLAEAKHTTLNIEIEDDGFGGYRANYNDNDINNHRNAGGVVQAKYYDAGANQTYTYYYSTMESDRKPTFVRTYIEDGKIKQVLASVGNNKKVTLARRTADTVTAQQMADAIGALGTVFDYKGSKSSKSDLPASGNQTGDVWFVEDESVGYIWLESGKWEPFGPTIDLTGYVQKTTKVNSKTLDKDITLTAADVKARPESWMPTAAQVGAIPATPGTAGQFAQSDGAGGIKFVSLPNLDTEAR